MYGDTKNTSCIQCTINKRDGKEKEHECFINFEGCAGAMEPAIAVEGINVLCEEGLKFSTLIADRDTNVYDTVSDKCVYGVEISKADCVNHTLKGSNKQLYGVRK